MGLARLRWPTRASRLRWLFRLLHTLSFRQYTSPVSLPSQQELMLAARTIRTSSLVLPRAVASSPRPAVALFSTQSARLQPHPQATYSDKGAMTGHLDTYVSFAFFRSQVSHVDADDALSHSAQSEVIVDHNNVKQLFHMYKKATSKEEKGTLVNTSALRRLAATLPVWPAPRRSRADTRQFARSHPRDRRPLRG